MPRDAAKTRSKILTAAHVAFYRHGYARVWMTDIARTAGVTKRTLYQHFNSKDALLEAMLEEQSALSAETFSRAVKKSEPDADAFVSDIFDDLADWAGQDNWTGPGITRLAMELGDLPGHPAMRFAAQHKTTLEALLTERLSDMPVSGPADLAREIWMVAEGAMMLALIHHDKGYIVSGKKAALSLVAARSKKVPA